MFCFVLFLLPCLGNFVSLSVSFFSIFVRLFEYKFVFISFYNVFVCVCVCVGRGGGGVCKGVRVCVCVCVCVFELVCGI